MSSELPGRAPDIFSYAFFRLLQPPQELLRIDSRNNASKHRLDIGLLARARKTSVMSFDLTSPDIIEARQRSE
jgi:hypothetical protein